MDSDLVMVLGVSLGAGLILLGGVVMIFNIMPVNEFWIVVSIYIMVGGVVVAVCSRILSIVYPWIEYWWENRKSCKHR